MTSEHCGCSRQVTPMEPEDLPSGDGAGGLRRFELAGLMEIDSALKIVFLSEDLLRFSRSKKSELFNPQVSQVSLKKLAEESI